MFFVKKVNIGLIGLGALGKIHLKNSINLKDVNLVGIADISKSALKYAKNFGVPETHYDYKDLLNNPDIDAVIISTPNYLHYEHASMAAENGKDIFIEKPLARNPAEGKKLLSNVRKTGIKLMVGYHLRFENNFSLLKDKLDDCFYGKILTATATYSSFGPLYHRSDTLGPIPIPEWWFDPELTGGGALLDCGCHMINLLTWYFGEVADVKSYLGYRFNMDFEDQAVCLLRFKEGPTATVNVSWFSREHIIIVDLYGTAKHVREMIPQSKSIMDYGIDAIKHILGRRPRTKSEKTALYKELEYFIECIKFDISPHPSGEEGLRDLEVIFKAYQNRIKLNSTN